MTGAADDTRTIECCRLTVATKAGAHVLITRDLDPSRVAAARARLLNTLIEWGQRPGVVTTEFVAMTAEEYEKLPATNLSGKVFPAAEAEEELVEEAAQQKREAGP